MSAKHDWTDWVGGLPFEFVSFEVLQAYSRYADFRWLTRAARLVGVAMNLCFGARHVWDSGLP